MLTNHRGTASRHSLEQQTRPDHATPPSHPLRVSHQVLYNELDQWREAETKRIKQAEVGERRKLALRELLHKETRLLQTIDRLKITAAHEGKVRIR